MYCTTVTLKFHLTLGWIKVYRQNRQQHNIKLCSFNLDGKRFLKHFPRSTWGPWKEEPNNWIPVWAEGEKSLYPKNLQQNQVCFHFRASALAGPPLTVLTSKTRRHGNITSNSKTLKRHRRTHTGGLCGHLTVFVFPCLFRFWEDNNLFGQAKWRNEEIDILKKLHYYIINFFYIYRI